MHGQRNIKLNEVYVQLFNDGCFSSGNKKNYANVLLPYMKLKEMENITSNFNYKSPRAY